MGTAAVAWVAERRGAAAMETVADAEEARAAAAAAAAAAARARGGPARAGAGAAARGPVVTEMAGVGAVEMVPEVLVVRRSS